MPCPQCAKPLEQNTACYSCGWESFCQEDPLIGQVIAERYKLLCRIGSGSCGAVYAAEHLALQSKIAIKILHISLGRDAVVVERFRREALVMSKLSHPHALKLFDRGQTPDGTLWFAMELLEGEPLSARLSRGEIFSERELVKLFESICEVLEEAHQQGIVHRDIKPANLVLVKGPGGALLAKLLDFGISDLRGAADLTHPKLVSGTPLYMAPEQWKGLAFADARSDVYSLGVVAYQCLSGKLPLDADSPLAWLKKHQCEEPTDLLVAMGRPISEGVAQTVMSALAKDPEARPQSASAFYQALKTDLPHKVNARLARRNAASLKKESGLTKEQTKPVPLPQESPLKVQEKAPVVRRRLPLLRFGFAGAVGFLVLGLFWLLVGSSSRSSAEPLNIKQAVISIAPEGVVSPQSAPLEVPPKEPTSTPLATNAMLPAPVLPKELASTPVLAKKQTEKIEPPQESPLKNKQGTIDPWGTVDKKSTSQPASIPTDPQSTINPWLVP